MQLSLRLSPPADPTAVATTRRPGPHEIEAPLARAVRERDDHRCQWCGFRSLKYQQVVLCGSNPRDVGAMHCACTFCLQCLELPTVPAMRSGVLVWLPEIAQTDLHHVARAVYVGRLARASELKALANQLLPALMARRDGASRELGSDDPARLVVRLGSSGDDVIDAATLHDAERRGLRLLPLDRRIIREADLEFNQFPQILAYWRSRDGPFGVDAPLPWLERALVALGLTPDAPGAPVAVRG